MIINVTAAHVARAVPGRSDPLELAAKDAGLKLSAGRSRIIVDHGHANRAGVFQPPAWWSLLWTRFHASGQMQWTAEGWRSVGGERVDIEPYSLEVPATALVVELRPVPVERKRRVA